MFRSRRPRVALHKAPYEDDCRYDIVGESYRMENILAVVKEGRRRKLTRQYGNWSKLGVQFWLVPEPTNEFDPNAVMVLAGTEEYDQESSILVGYVNRNDAKRMSKRLNRSFPVLGVLVGTAGKFGAKLDRETLRDAELLS
ncbi:MAG: hypothetical protein OXS33_07570 [bacterium]|nr:hypothetical protein [bacterium]MDE0500700.1 hypothetical protein [bacterium]